MWYYVTVTTALIVLDILQILPKLYINGACCPDLTCMTKYLHVVPYGTAEQKGMLTLC